MDTTTEEIQNCRQLSEKMLRAINDGSDVKFTESNNTELGKYTMLYFAYADIKNKSAFRDDQKNLIRPTGGFSLVLDSGINRHGVGDGKLPAVARTYSIDFCIHAEKREYKHKTTYQTEFLKFHGYSRDMDDVVERFRSHLTKSLAQYPRFNPDKYLTGVIYRKYPDGEVIALFSDSMYDGSATHGRCMSYMHVGQHSEADPVHVIHTTKPATPEEYDALERELWDLGYIFSVVHKKFPVHS